MQEVLSGQVQREGGLPNEGEAMQHLSRGGALRQEQPVPQEENNVNITCIPGKIYIYME